MAYTRRHSTIIFLGGKGTNSYVALCWRAYISSIIAYLYSGWASASQIFLCYEVEDKDNTRTKYYGDKHWKLNNL